MTELEPRRLRTRAVDVLPDDEAQRFLLGHLKRSEEMFRLGLKGLDAAADCMILPAADLGIPFDALRLAGGFATGCYVEWQCQTPVVPIDITMNIDTSSVFWLSDDSSRSIPKETFERVRARVEDQSSYEWNFDGGNHFISLCESKTKGLALVIHSNEKEFKNQYNGLCPTPGNWFAESVVNLGPPPHIRCLVGDKAELFVDMAKMLEEYNVCRHRFVATMLLEGQGAIVEESHSHHYFMPSRSSAALGCYVSGPGDIVPIFSSPGVPIVLFRVADGGGNQVEVASGETRMIVPHGWGIGSAAPISYWRAADSISLNDHTYQLKPGTSLLDHPDFGIRSFSDCGDFLRRLGSGMPGEIIDELVQLTSHSRAGHVHHEPAERD